MARTAAPRCSVRGCKLIASQPSGRCRKHLKAECDRLFALQIRNRGVCELGDPPHNGALQCCHGFSRRFLSIRWNPENAFAGCAKHHQMFTLNPDLWSFWLLDRWGVKQHAAMREMATQTLVKVDMEAVYAELQGAS